MYCTVQYRLTEEISRIMLSKHYRPLYCKVDINICTFGRQIYSKKVSQFIVNKRQLKKVNRVIIKFSDEKKLLQVEIKKTNSYKYTIEIYCTVCLIFIYWTDIMNLYMKRNLSSY